MRQSEYFAELIRLQINKIIKRVTVIEKKTFSFSIELKKG